MKKQFVFSKIFLKIQNFQNLVEKRLKRRGATDKRTQGHEESQKSWLIASDAIESVRARMFRQPRSKASSQLRISHGSFKSVSLDTFDAPSIPAFVRSVAQRLQDTSQPRFRKLRIFKNIFINYELKKYVFINVFRKINFIRDADSRAVVALPK